MKCGKRMKAGGPAKKMFGGGGVGGPAGRAMLAQQMGNRRDMPMPPRRSGPMPMPMTAGIGGRRSPPMPSPTTPQMMGGTEVSQGNKKGGPIKMKAGGAVRGMGAAKRGGGKGPWF